MRSSAFYQPSHLIPHFSWTNNALSDLGVVSGITSLTLQLWACCQWILSFQLLPYLAYITYLWEKLGGQNWLSCFCGRNLALIAIGIFNENFSPTHYFVSVAFFMLVPISLFILTCAFWLSHQRGMAVFTVLVGVAAALPWLLLFAFNYVPNVAIPEFLSGLAVSVWAVVVGKKMLNPKVLTASTYIWAQQ